MSDDDIQAQFLTAIMDDESWAMLMEEIESRYQEVLAHFRIPDNLLFRQRIYPAMMKKVPEIKDELARSLIAYGLSHLYGEVMIEIYKSQEVN